MQLLKALMLVSDVAFTLDQELAFIDEVKPYLKQLVADKMRSSASIEKSAMDITSKLEDLAAVPKELSGILEMAFGGKLKVDISAREVTTLSNTIKRTTDKIGHRRHHCRYRHQPVAGHDESENPYSV